MRLIGWFKIRFVFTDEQLLDTVDFINRVDRKRLNDERIWKEAQDAKIYILKELIRRGHTDLIKGA